MLLLILKGIGILLLIILAILIFILCLVLFVPIRYQFEGNYHDVLNGKVYVKWFPVFLKVQGSYNGNQLEYVMKLFGGVVMTNTDQKLSWIGRKFFSSNGDGADDSIGFGLEDEAEAMPKEDFSGITKESDFKTKESDFETKESDLETRNSTNLENKKKNGSPTKKKTSRNKKKKEKYEIKKDSIFDKISKKWKEIKESWHNFANKVKTIRYKKEELLRVYHSKRFGLAKKDVIDYGKNLLHILKPDWLDGYIRFGMEDPATTGEILGVLAVLFPLYQNYLVIYPDFSEKCLEAELKGKGKIILFPIVKLMIKIILNKNLIKVTKKVQTIIEA